MATKSFTNSVKITKDSFASFSKKIEKNQKIVIPSTKNIVKKVTADDILKRLNIKY